VYSRTLKSATALSAGKHVDLYSDDSGAGKTYHDLLLRPDIQAVILALPIMSQPEYIEAALAAGKHVLSEKPIAADIKRARHLIAYYKGDKVKGGATWGVAENFRFLESFEFARQEVSKLGRILGFQVKVFGHVKPGGNYFGKIISDTVGWEFG
jgi:predicted dehydrogenase